MTEVQVEQAVCKVFSGMPERMMEEPVRIGIHHLGTLRTVSQDIARAIAALSAPSEAPIAAGVVEAIKKVRDGYVSQMKFCDIEAMGYFREFVRRIDKALSSLPATNGEAK